MADPLPHLGVDPKWMKAYKKQRGHNLGSRDNLLTRDVQRLETYAQSGHIESPMPPGYVPVEVTPTWEPWESDLDSYIALYGNFSQMDFEEETVETGAWAWAPAARAVQAMHLAMLIKYHIAALFPTRFPGRTLDRVSTSDIGYAALAVIMDAPEAEDMVQVCLKAYRNRWVLLSDHFPIYIFMFRLLADHRGDPPLTLEGEAVAEPYTRALFDVWRTDDLDLLAERCLAVLDFHTHRCRAAGRDGFHEFDDGSWMRCPIEILLLFKLRELNGQANPKIDHPLTETALGRLPRSGPWKIDPLIERVGARMRADGFDPAVILARG